MTPSVATLSSPVPETASPCCANDPASLLDHQTAADITDDLQLLAHPVRLQILDILARRGGEICVCHLVEALPVKQPTISHHLRLLKEGGLVVDERRGLWAYYHIAPERLKALRAGLSGLLTDMEDACCAPDR